MNNSGNKLEKISFKLENDDWHHMSVESVWAEKISELQYRIMNTPFYIRGVSYLDTIKIKIQSDELWFQSTILESGHSTYRIIIRSELLKDEALMYWQNLESIGCTYESTHIGDFILLAVDIPPDTDIQTAFEIMKQGEDNEIWSFEEGHFGHIQKG